MKLLALPLALALLTPVSVKAAETASPVKAEVGKPAPDFKGTDATGATQTLSQYKGKTVVLEWTNPGCPYVVKHYDSKNMQALQKEATDAGVVWLSVNSSAVDKEGHQTPEAATAYLKEKGTASSALILDGTGEIGHLYGAQTTPHMYVINPEGVLVYAGAIDDNDSFKPETIEGAKNYVREALAALKDGKPVEVASTKPYGCGVKYLN